MTVKECIDFVDAIKPNAFTNQQKTTWLNECEGLVQTDVFLWAIEQIIQYEYYEPFSTLSTYAVGDYVELGGRVYCCSTAVTTPGVWDANDWTEDTTKHDDKNKTLLVAPPHDKLYRSYLTAMIDFANGEYDRYQNTMTLFNMQFGEFMRWFALNYKPADTHREVYGI